ncbi:uncharacterized protein LOC120905197 [Anopheles arabiensis]|uniref:MARVEL domain-containing protein n=2 Tax=gambiae species complex TaxID=44542 RepID=A0A6E8VS26_ANOCL|nr:uncharacterized protein LOC120905197 [Anopheles arabiensis]XP_040223822.1 uncharacterized protein LOC120950116 [Anopheles coluzzii]XP_041768627.1 uncharacterized protein LOC121591769 [Anopheles merus]XP_308507.4 uncharacterized protein LOC1269855 [Anopheles gambiae]
MERPLRRYVKAHGYAIAISALFFGCIFVASILNEDQLSRSASEYAFFRSRPLEQLIFSIAWIAAGLIFLLGLICERKEAIFPFATIFLVEWSLVLVQLVSKLEHRDLVEVVLSAEAAVFLLVPLYVGYTLVILYRAFDSQYKDEAVEDIEQARRPVKFFFGEDPDDTYS